MRILITGAAGRLGTVLRRELARAGHQLRLVDIKPIENAEGESLLLDITDGKAVLHAMEGVDAVAHLAFGAIVRQRPLENARNSFDVNVKSTYLLLWAAHRRSVQRFLYTSTLSVFGSNLELGRGIAKGRLTEESMPCPSDVYGLTKYLGEAACRFFAERRGMSVVCLRLCNLASEEDWRHYSTEEPKTENHKYWRAMATRLEDVARAIHLALTKPDIRYETIHIAADNPGRVTEIQRAKDVLGFTAEYRLRS